MSDLRYLCTNEKSFRRYTTLDKKKFSFNVVSSAAGYWNYLSLITENEKLFLQRRNGFLDHLLSRFAETFTDYALLSYSFLKESSLQQNNIQYKEKFLSAYPALSSMRGGRKLRRMARLAGMGETTGLSSIHAHLQSVSCIAERCGLL